jgi:hypothetical protein
MKTRLSVVLLLTAICVLLITAGTGTGHAQPPQLTPQAYLPIISVPCLRETSAYMTASAPLIHVGDTLTITIVVVNECAQTVSKPGPLVWGQPTGILFPESANGNYDPQLVIGAGGFHSFTATLQAIQPGEVTLLGGASFENVMLIDGEWSFYWDATPAALLPIRVVP